MAQDSENRLKKIMDKLYYAPRPRLSPLSRLGGGDVVARKDTVARILASRGTMEKSVPCRPWDRSDLIRRLSTFKAMTWFGKPKVISSLSCARRGWINVEMDVIVCEACGARLFFSTPASWALQQVEKAAAVFSLKLDNGHKLLCPWIDNACNEPLASFPPSSPQVLVEGFKERFHALSQLTTLPVISSLTVDSMNSPQLDRFLSAPFHPSVNLNNGISLTVDCRSKDLYDRSEDGDSHGYYQALKIISLCGWEPRLLPYTIELESKCGPSAKTVDQLESSEEIHSETAQNITKCSSNSHNDVGGRVDSYSPHGEYLFDQSSTVLDCRFCGACVGLWFFKMIPRPLEFFKIVIDSSTQSELATGTADLAHGAGNSRVENFCSDQNSNIGKPFGLHLSIAGGPPPTKQHFRPKISLTVVRRHIGAEFSYDSSFRCHHGSSGMEDHSSKGKDFNDHHDAGSEAVGSLKRRRSEIEISEPQLHRGNHGDEGHGLAGEGVCEHVSEEIMHDTPYTDVVVRGDTACNDSLLKPTDARKSNDTVSRLDQCNFGDEQENDHCDPLLSASSSFTNVNLFNHSNSSDEGACFQTFDRTSSSKQDSIELAKKVSVSIPQEDGVDHLLVNLKQTQAIDFDPIKQHRPFCSWISDVGKNLPGWKATLSALDDLGKYPSQQTEQTEAATNLLDDADDPIVSIRKLFSPPSSKRLKRSQ